ncbi:MAG: amidohydrolase family protein [Gemmatales bacterium]|nr:amidohydrolase family protein [Gemmatales bacterium]
MNSDAFVELGKAGAPVQNMFVIDCHAHLGQANGFEIIDSSVEGLIRVMDRLGIALTAVASLPACIGGVIKKGNDQIIDAVQRYPSRIFGYMSVNPQYRREALAELNRCLRAGLRGIKVHSLQGTRYHHPAYSLIWEFAAEHNLPILVHGGPQEIEDLEPCFSRYPALRWIIAHAGAAPEREPFIRVALAYPNVFVDPTLSTCPRGMIEYFMAQGLEDKLLWGSDSVFLNAPSQFGRVLFARITTEQKTKILSGNAQKIFTQVSKP